MEDNPNKEQPILIIKKKEIPIVRLGIAVLSLIWSVPYMVSSIYEGLPRVPEGQEDYVIMYAFFYYFSFFVAFAFCFYASRFIYNTFFNVSGGDE